MDDLIDRNEYYNQALQFLRIQLQELKTADTSLNQSVGKIQQLVNQLASSSDKGDRGGEYYSQIFDYDKNSGYVRLKRAGKNELRISQMHQLQQEINEFISKFMQRPVTQYVFYYIDALGQYRRADLSQADDNLLSSIYSKKTPQTIYLQKKTKETIDAASYSTIISNHFELYAADTAKYVKSQTEWSEQKRNYNLGHVAESFERHISTKMQVHQEQIINSLGVDWNKTEILQNYEAAKNNTPWWKSGDVYDKQVKFLGSSQSVRTGSQRSVEELANYIIWLYNNAFTNTDIEAIAKSVAHAFVDLSGANQYANTSLDYLLANSFQMT